MPAIRYDGNLETSAKNVPLGANAPVYTLPYAVATIYTDSTLTTLVLIFSDQALTVALPNPLTSDSQGRFGFWVNSGYYVYTITDQFGNLVGTYSLSLLAGNNGAQGPPLTFKGAWVNTTAYSYGDGVQGSDGAGYVSLVLGANTGHDPTTSPTQWGQYAAAGRNGEVTTLQLVTTTAPPTVNANLALTSLGIDIPVTTTSEQTITNTDTLGASGQPVDAQIAQGLAVVLPSPVVHTGALATVTTSFISVTTGQTLRMLILNQTGSAGQFTVVDSFSVTPNTVSGYGIQTFHAGTDYAARNVTAGQFIGYSTNGGASPAFKGSGAPTGVGFYIVAGDPGSGQITYSDYLVGAGYLDLSATITYSETVPVSTTVYGNTIATIPNVNGNRTVMLSQSFAGTSLPSGWTAVGAAWTANNGLISPSTGQGYGSYIYLARYAALGKTVTRVSFEILASGSILGFGSVLSPTEANAPIESLFVVNSATNTLAISNNGWSGSNPGVLVSTALGFTMTTGRIYTLIIAVNERQITLSMTDPLTAITATVSAGDNTDTTAYPGATPWGTTSDYCAFANIAGQSKIHQLIILADQSHSHTVMVGDSITYGSYLNVAQRWATLIGNQIGKPYLVSGRPGATSYGALGRMQSEVKFIRPDRVILLIGTNDTFLTSIGAYKTNIQAIVDQLATENIPLVVCILPTLASNQSGVNTLNTFLLTLTGVTFARFDLATSVGNDGVTQNTSLFVSDGTHPNAAGSVAIDNRFTTDAAFILD